MTEKRFKLTHLNHIDVKGLENLLNDLNDELEKVKKENEQLRLQLNNCSDQRNEFHHGARENANRVGKLKKENEQLRKENKELHFIIQQNNFAKQEGFE